MVSGSALRVSSCNRAWTPAAGGVRAARWTARADSVSSPVSTTTARACPATTVVPSKTMQLRSATAALGVGAVCLSTGSDSPVSADSSTSRPSSHSSRASAGTTSSAPSSMTSPGCSLAASTVRGAASGVPARTRALRFCSSSSPDSARSARSRWTPPTRALRSRAPRTRRASTAEPRMAEAAEPTARTGVSGSSSSPRTARPSCQDQRAGASTRIFPARSASSRARAVACSTGPGCVSGSSCSRFWTSFGFSACQATRGRGCGARDTATPSAARAPV